MMPSREQLRKFRAEFTELIPWVNVLKRPKAHCAAFTVPYYRLGFKTRRDMTAADESKYRCKHRGLFHFTALKGEHGGKTGTYCETHLRTVCIFASMAEDERFQRWCEKNIFTLNALRVKYGLPPVPTKRELEVMHGVEHR
jgi:hypothetical protein